MLSLCDVLSFKQLPLVAMGLTYQMWDCQLWEASVME